MFVLFSWSNSDSLHACVCLCGPLRRLFWTETDTGKVNAKGWLFLFGIVIDSIGFGHVLHVHALGAIQKCAVQDSI